MLGKAGTHQSDFGPVCPPRTATEHVEQLQRWIHEVCELGLACFGELGSRLQGYRNMLATELAMEESQGLLSGVSMRHPECGDEIGELRRQHGQFLDELDAMIVKLQQDMPPYDSWQEAVRQFEELLTEICRHDGRERQLLASMAEKI